MSEDEISMAANQLVPELSVSNFAHSLDFYTRILGFSIVYQRQEDGFAFLALDEAQIMIDAIDPKGTWQTAPFEYPLRRGINFQIAIEQVQPLLDTLQQNNIALFITVQERWYRKNDTELGQKQFLVQDPDGYLLRFTEDIGSRPLQQLPDS